MDLELRSPVLVAAWPGMGGVAQIAVTALVRLLGAKVLEELDPGSFFEPQGVLVRGGRLLPMGLPRSVFYGWRHPGQGPDLLILLGDQQPPTGVHRYAAALLEIAARRGASRVYTFAAMATQLEVGHEARVFAGATDDGQWSVLKADGVSLLESGDISGLNGVFLAAAAERGLPGVCLLGEFPFVAANLPNPRASAAILQAFARFTGLKLDTREMMEEARRVEQALLEHMRRVAQAQREQATESGATDGNTGEQGLGEDLGDQRGDSTQPSAEEDPADRARIEELFAQATADRTKALQLKAELDRLGVFRRYEDRFLDLFRRAG